MGREGVTPELLLERCLTKSRLYVCLLSDFDQHKVFALSATPEGRARLARAPFRLPPLVLGLLERWHREQDGSACLAARLKLLARYVEYAESEPPAEWDTLMRIVKSRAHVTEQVKAQACILCSLLFDYGDAPLRRMTRDHPPYQAVFTAYAMELSRIQQHKKM